MNKIIFYCPYSNEELKKMGNVDLRAFHSKFEGVPDFHTPGDIISVRDPYTWKETGRYEVRARQNGDLYYVNLVDDNEADLPHVTQ